MAWTELTDVEVLEEFTQAELNALNAVKGTQALIGIVTRTVAEVRGAIDAGNYPLGTDGTIPDGLKADAIAIARWRFLISVSKNEGLQTEDRRKAFERAQKKLDDIVQQNFAPEAPVAGVAPSTGTWNSENKLIPRTHPVPTPSTQFQSTDSTARPYANPETDAEQDQ